MKVISSIEFSILDNGKYRLDIASQAWWVHDRACEGKWNDGTDICNWECSQILQDILAAEGRWWQSKYWFAATFLFGGGKARKNGMFKVRTA